PVGVGPNFMAEATVVGVAPLKDRGRARFLRVDLADGGLGSHRRSLRLLSMLVLGVNGAVSLLVFLFLRHLLAPWEAMLEKAKEVHSEPLAEQDEIAFLLSTFERAVQAESRPAPPAAEDDIAALQRALSASLESGLLLLDREGTVLALNPVGRQLLHLEEEVTVGSELEEALADHPSLLALLQSVVGKGEGIKRHEVEISTPAGPRILGLTAHLLH
ncbi:MAG: hypothetical protein KDD47_26355, partial [Acidobacteria bacterium]|nr:hypothetical protein [Acidobacteriota bacterium]